VRYLILKGRIQGDFSGIYVAELIQEAQAKKETRRTWKKARVKVAELIQEAQAKKGAQ
jgi:hypothetical protein